VIVDAIVVEILILVVDVVTQKERIEEFSEVCGRIQKKVRCSLSERGLCQTALCRAYRAGKPREIWFRVRVLVSQESSQCIE
jgi:hypothetical protein